MVSFDWKEFDAKLFEQTSVKPEELPRLKILFHQLIVPQIKEATEKGEQFT